MKFLSDAALGRLQIAADEPDLAGTPYELIERVGRGGMGVVYRVRDRRLDRDVALKVLDLAAPGGDEDERLRREARVLAGLEHPGIVPVHDLGALADGRAFYVMKLVQGERLDERAPRMGSLGERLRLFVRLCEPVAFAHRQGVVHRDLKPENVMIGPFGEVLVMDWGAARVGGARGGAPGAVVGTEGYMSPEQARGDTIAVDQRSDVYALGAVLRFLIDQAGGAGRSPAPLRSIVARACAGDPTSRYASVPELAADIECFLDRRRVTAHREGWSERLGRWFRRYETAIVLVLVYVVLRMLLLLAMHR